ncbi:MAG: hypothetical protein WCV59_02205 [Parcubacteria group bacterium]|jgi:hypothetical protein
MRGDASALYNTDDYTTNAICYPIANATEYTPGSLAIASLTSRGLQLPLGTNILFDTKLGTAEGKILLSASRVFSKSQSGSFLKVMITDDSFDIIIPPLF